MTLDELNALPQAAAQQEFVRCCGSTRWCVAMADNRPYRGETELYHKAESLWWQLDAADWLEAFGHHPRIGERAAGWAKDEQSGTRSASDETLRTFTELNREYETKFGHVFLIFATGKSAEEMLSALRVRLKNDGATELRIAAVEQAKITRLRLEKLLGATLESSRAG